MFSTSRNPHAGAYGFGQSYSYPGPTYGQFAESPAANEVTYQQNLWPTVYSTTGSCGRQYEEWVQNTGSCPRNSPQSYGACPQGYSLHRTSVDPPTILLQQDLNAGPEGQASPGSVVALSSDGLSGSESPGLHGLNRPQPARSPFEWMKKSSYQNQPNPGKTRTKDKYRVVYSDHQRLELEKEFHCSRYITIRRKTEVASMLGLSERQVKIWFQNRRAKDRKQEKKNQELLLFRSKDPLNQAIASFNTFKPLLQIDQDHQATKLLWNHDSSKDLLTDD